ncbi:MAG: dihydrolipoamide acetyltransferase family protein [Dermatophilaceae bacterium]
MSLSSGPNSPSTFMLPDLGEGLTEAEVVEWHVAEGDEVQVDQVVVTVETAKASVDLPCPYAGRVGTLHAAVGGVLEVGRPLITIGANEKSGSGSVLVGYGTSEAKRSHRRRVTSGGALPDASTISSGGLATSAVPGVDTVAKVAKVVESPATKPTLAPMIISPVVRKLAKDIGVDLTGIAPSGHDQVIRRADVEAASRPVNGDQPHSVVRADRTGDIRIPLRGVRKAIADKMTTSRREIPDVTTWVDVDATALMAAKDEIKAVNPEAGIGILALMARISMAGLRKFPELNARVDTEAQELVQLRDINLSFAAQSPRGLMVPVIHGAGEMTTAQLAAALHELTALARDGALSPAQMTGGTFTLNNYGVFGVDGSTPIINYPEAAMLGIGRIFERPWAHDGQLALRKVTQLAFTFDHRVCDGGTAGGFLRFVADCVERPTSLLALL